MLIEGGAEDDRRARLAERRGDVESGAAGHLDVQEDDVGGERLDPFQRLDAVLGLSDHLDVRAFGEQLLEPAPRRRLVVDDERPQGHGRLHRLSTVTSSWP